MGKERKNKIKIRRAKLGDLGLFRKLWEEYLSDEQLLAAGGVAATEHNMEVFERMFNVYVSGDLDGTVLFHAEDGVLMYGDPGELLFENVNGRQANGWGLYVKESARGKGVSTALRTKAVNILRTMGFDSLWSVTDPANEEKYAATIRFGFKPGMRVVHYIMKENT